MSNSPKPTGYRFESWAGTVDPQIRSWSEQLPVGPAGYRAPASITSPEFARLKTNAKDNPPLGAITLDNHDTGFVACNPCRTAPRDIIAVLVIDSPGPKTRTSRVACRDRVCRIPCSTADRIQGGDCVATTPCTVVLCCDSWTQCPETKFSRRSVVGRRISRMSEGSSVNMPSSSSYRLSSYITRLRLRARQKVASKRTLRNDHFCWIGGCQIKENRLSLVAFR
jgi:hypothetical protein